MQGTSHLHQRKLERILGLVLLICTIGAYWYLLRCDFVFFDDPSYVTENPHVRAGLNWASFAWAFATFHSSNWHPLTWLSHMLDCDLYGLNPAGHHLTNLLFHVGNTLLLFLFLREATGTNWRSFSVAALFSLHPLHVESVAWVSERKDVLSTFFWMLALVAYVHYVRKPDILRYLSVLLLFTLGLMAKPMVVTFPFVLLLLDYWPLRQTGSLPSVPFWGKVTGRNTSPSMGKSVGGGRHLIWEKAPFFLMSAASCIVTYLAQAEGQAIRTLENLPIYVRAENALVSYNSYVLQTFWPEGLTVFYPYSVSSLDPGLALVSALLLGGLSAAAIWQASRRPYLCVGCLWYLGTLVPVIGLVQVGDQSMADRYTYLPLIGLFIALVWGLSDLFESSRVRRIFTISLACTVLFALMVITRSQVRRWQNTQTLFEYALLVTENNYLAHLALAQAARLNGDLDRDTFHTKKAVEINPAYVAKIHNRCGYALAEEGNLGEAISEFEEALQIVPAYANAHNNLGVVLARKARYDEALEHFAAALEITPGDTKIMESRRNVEAERERVRASKAADF